MNITVLITCAGSAAAVSIIKSLKKQDEIRVKIVAVDASELSAGLYLADEHYQIPPIEKENEYLKALLNICITQKVDVLIPGLSKELLLLATNRTFFSSIGVKMLLPDNDVISFCNNKILALQLVAGLNIPVPKTFDRPKAKHLPIIAKPHQGSGSVGVEKVVDMDSLELFLKRKGMIFQEYISGKEYTVDIICDESSQVLFAGPRLRIEVRSGQMIKGITVKNEILSQYATKICRAIKMVGVCNIQFIEREELFYFIEINPRYPAGGGVMLTTHAGVNLPLIALKIMLNMKISLEELQCKQGKKMIRYWNEIII